MLRTDALTQNEFRMVAVAARAAIRALPGTFEVSGAIDDAWLSNFRLAHARLLLCGLTYLFFQDDECADALCRATEPDIVIDDASHVLPLGRWHSEVIFSFSHGVLQESDLTSIQLIMDLCERWQMTPDLIQGDINSNVLKPLQGRSLLERAFAARLYQTIDHGQPARPFHENQSKRHALTEPHFEFWLRWYEGFVLGEPVDWALQRSIALLPDVDWDKGPEWISLKIAEIEREHHSSVEAPLQVEAVKQQAARLLGRPLVLATSAKGLQQLTQMAIDAYRREVSNALPDCIAPLEDIPVIAHEIAFLAARDLPLSDKEALLSEQIQLMAGVIAELNTRLQRAAMARRGARYLPMHSTKNLAKGWPH